MNDREPSPGWRIAIDRGGTFTDIVARDPAGRQYTHKVLSRDPAHPGDAAVRGIEEVLEHHARNEHRIASVRLGTTVATNALLERKGEPTVLLITAGFRDLLTIGHQHRPDIFALEIRRATGLFSSVIEARERIAADGRVLESLDEAALARDLAQARAAGLRSVAIAFLHSVVRPDHEQLASKLALDTGFDEIVMSHAVASMVGLIARGDSAVADAYLSPVLLKHLREFRAELRERHGEVPLLLMQSNGGLVDADGFRGIHGVLSGPAGGVVGLAAVGAAAGRDHVVGLDMGGTSTDVSLYAGTLPRRYQAEIDGVRLHAPMLDVHTIAAGGGSVVRYADGRLQVGPESAGADPGPACYRRGGPATVTDCNVVLGRIQPERFPRVFGPSGDAPLDQDASRARLAAIADSIASEGGPRYSIEALAEGFIEVAVTKMAFAIRELALRHGEDSARFTLVPFGGAAGQHACAVADLLGIDTILLHPLAGVLSAWGIALARRRCIRQRSLEVQFDEAGHSLTAVALGELEREACAELTRQGLETGAIDCLARVHLRAAGSDTTLELDWRPPDALRSEFLAAHQRLYGYTDAAASIVIASASVEAAETDPEHALESAPIAPKPPGALVPAVAADSVATWSAGVPQTVPFYLRESLAPGHSLAGPALLGEQGATAWIAPGWTGTVGSAGLVLERVTPIVRPAASSIAADPLRLEVYGGLFMHVAEQMGVVLRQTASSVNIKERLDYSCALFDSDANLVANAPHMPVHLGSMGASVTAVLEDFAHDLRPGDAFLLNSPYHGGTHLPDMTVVTPVFDSSGERPRFFTASRAHHADIGGVTPGSMPPLSREIGEEGALIVPVRIVRDGRFDEALVRRMLTDIPWPARNPDQNIADLRAQLAANARGIREIERAAARYGWSTLLAFMGHVQDNAEQCMRRAIGRLCDGEFGYEMDSGQHVEVRIRVNRETGAATVDFTGTSPQLANNFNAPRAVTVAAVLYVFRTLVTEPIPLNAGCLRPLTIVVPPRSMLDPSPPGAVVAGNVETSQCVVDALYGALGLQSAAQGTMNNFTFGSERYQYYETIAGGSGAGPDYDGTSGVQTHMTNSRLTDPEVLERRFPVLLREFSLRAGSGGAGAHRGGDGLVREFEFRESMTAALLANHRRVRPFGLAGGEPGMAGIDTLTRREGGSETVPATAEFAVDAGDRFRIETPGGGGYGRRVTRDD